jgi:hypothetical protein
MNKINPFQILLALVKLYLEKPILVMLVFLPLAAILVYVVWSRAQHPPTARKWYTLAFVGFSLIDWALLRLLAALELSFAYERPMVMFLLLRSVLFILVAQWLLKISAMRRQAKPPHPAVRGGGFDSEFEGAQRALPAAHLQIRSRVIILMAVPARAQSEQQPWAGAGILRCQSR